MPVRRQDRVSDGLLNALLQRYEAGTVVDEKKTIHFHHDDFDELERILVDAFEIDPAFTQRQRRALCRQALRTCRKEGRLNINALLEEIRHAAELQLAVPRQQFSLWMKFRAAQMAFAEKFGMSWAGVSLESAYQLPTHLAVNEYFLSGHGHISPQELPFNGHLIVRCEEREEECAVRRMLDAVDLFMAIFNMYALWGKSYGSDRWAEARLFNGPYMFVFQGHKFLGEERIWFDPTFSEEAWAMSPPDMNFVLKLIPDVQRALAKLECHALRTIIVRVLLLMQNAMSSRDYSYGLLRYWSALETLYSEQGSRNKNYNLIIRRATFAEIDKDVARWKLSHIARLRNEYVHAGGDDDDLKLMSQSLRMLLSRHVNYLLFNAPDIRDHGEWLEFVDLPDGEKALGRRRSIVEERLAFMTRGRSQSSED